MSDGIYTTAVAALVGAVGWLLARHIRRVDAIDTRLQRLEEIVKTLARHRLSPGEMASLYRPDWSED